MNSWKLNGHAGHIFRKTVCDSLKIHHTEIYRKVKDIDTYKGIITMKDGKKYKLELKEI
jgi:hypothetical protein